MYYLLCIFVEETESQSSGGRIQDKDSGYKTISDITSSQV